MAEGRMLKKKLSKSRKFAMLKTDQARLLYCLLLAHLDIEGRYEGDASVVKGRAVPRLKTFSEEIVEECLQDLHRVKLIELYEHNEDRFLQYVDFDKNQTLRRDRERPSDLPGPPLPDNSRSNPGELPSQDKIREDKLREDNKPPLPPLPDPPELKPSNGHDPDHVLTAADLKLFNAFWDKYPKQVGRIPAKRAFKTILNREKHLPDMLIDLDRRKNEDPQWQREQGRFIPKPTTYLEDYLWTDKGIRDTRFDNLGENKE